jgi:hypothetical protein
MDAELLSAFAAIIAASLAQKRVANPDLNA